MKLKSKDSGKVLDLLTVALDKSGAIILMVEYEGRREMLAYKSLAQLHKELEDYDEAEKPALTKEERQYIDAWLMLITCVEYDAIRKVKDGLRLLNGSTCVSATPTFGRFRWWPEDKSYTLEELGFK